MKRHQIFVIFWFILGGFLTITTMIFGAGIFGLLLGLIFFSVGIWYWVRTPHEPECYSCGMICNEGVKSCPNCDGKIKRDHTGLTVAIILGGFFGFFTILGFWIIHVTCTEYTNTPIHQWFNC